MPQTTNHFGKVFTPLTTNIQNYLICICYRKKETAEIIENTGLQIEFSLFYSIQSFQCCNSLMH